MLTKDEPPFVSRTITVDVSHAEAAMIFVNSDSEGQAEFLLQMCNGIEENGYKGRSWLLQCKLIADELNSTGHGMVIAECLDTLVYAIRADKTKPEH